MPPDHDSIQLLCKYLGKTSIGTLAFAYGHPTLAVECPRSRSNWCSQVFDTNPNPHTETYRRSDNLAHSNQLINHQWITLKYLHVNWDIKKQDLFFSATSSLGPAEMDLRHESSNTSHTFPPTDTLRRTDNLAKRITCLFITPIPPYWLNKIIAWRQQEIP